jgi:hypothetical protein
MSPCGASMCYFGVELEFREYEFAMALLSLRRSTLSRAL